MRKAATADMLRLLSVAHELHSEQSGSLYTKGTVFSARRAAVTLIQCIKRDDRLCLIAEDEEHIAGVFLGFVSQFSWSEDLHSCDIHFFVRPGFRGTEAASSLLEVYVQWALSQGVAEHRITLGSRSSADSKVMSRFLRMRGFEKSGDIYSFRGEAA